MMKERETKMITRAKLVELLNEHQIKSQHTSFLLACFSPNPHISTRKDLSVALSYSILFCLLIISFLATFKLRYFKISCGILFCGILLLVCLKISRHKKIKRKRERRFLLPISM
ncbi:hypothetical protein LUZ60_006069 [Juncus effusus]|nr:hypothetical protein LUZ60_006069 [Juncus effusus]